MFWTLLFTFGFQVVALNTAAGVVNDEVLVLKYNETAIFDGTVWRSGSPSPFDPKVVVPLANRRALVVNGLTSNLYDLESDEWTFAGLSSIAWAWVYAVVALDENRVMFIGKPENDTSLSESCEIWENGVFTRCADVAICGAYTATRLLNGQVLVVGSTCHTGSSRGAVQLYNVQNDEWIAQSSPQDARTEHSSILLLNGKVLITGGRAGYELLRTTEIYGEGKWTRTGDLSRARWGFTLTMLPSGSVVAAGGYDGERFPTVELYDPLVGKWSEVFSLTAKRYYGSAAIVYHDHWYVFGGFGHYGLQAESNESYKLSLFTTADKERTELLALTA